MRVHHEPLATSDDTAMGYRISRLNDPPGLLIAFEGIVTAATLVDAIGEAASHMAGGATGPPPALWDTRGVESLILLPEDLPPLDLALAGLAGTTVVGRAAFVCGRDQTDVQMVMRLLLARAPKGGRERAMFTDYDAAVDRLREA